MTKEVRRVKESCALGLFSVAVTAEPVDEVVLPLVAARIFVPTEAAAVLV
jgi:hypothetical protein